MTQDETALSARPSTHAWCLVCKSVQPTIDKPLVEGMRRYRPKADGATLHCCGCQTALLVIYACEETR